ncbi:helix-turn-helix domain-containing protein [Glycomyces tritici]|uniref:Helix-turn-helix domain-containing protein n=1 Tax=Glycomyces tritici TaxID=2665176 RepID=A0ABT7YRW2_9ACTN|nr:helix-turn-helix domain-containing protein [Glycomyces tritici]MDN3240993.1 helix-turn-helix domain-containing protein [Glycomyces tritici]
MTPTTAAVNAHTGRADLDVEPFYTVRESGEILRIGRSKLYEEMAQGRLKAIKVGRATRIPAEWLKDYRDLLIAEGLEAAPCPN